MDRQRLSLAQKHLEGLKRDQEEVPTENEKPKNILETLVGEAVCGGRVRVQDLRIGGQGDQTSRNCKFFTFEW